MYNFGSTRLFRSYLAILIPILISVLLMPAPAPAGSADNGLTIGVETIRGFDALRAIATLSTAMAANTILEPLFYLDEKGDLVPVLGLSAEPSADGKEWTVVLRPGVFFHDGAPFNADAVTAHWNRILDPKNRFVRRLYIEPISSVEKVDDYTVLFKLKYPWAAFKMALAWNRSFTSLIPSPSPVSEEARNLAPVGTGPFRFVEWKQSDHLVVEKNDRYWNPDLPRVKRIVFRTIPDHQTRYASLVAGELDIMYTDRGSHIVKAQKDDSLRVLSAEDNGAEIILLNNKRPPLDDLRVRKALVRAWDQARYIAVSYRNTIPVVHDFFGPDFGCQNLAWLGYDPKAARADLADYGQAVKLEYLHTNSQRGRDAGQIFQQMCKDVGLELATTPLDIGPIVQKVLQGDYQASSWRILSAPDPGPVMFVYFHSKSPANLSNYADPEMDELLEKQRRETDPDRRRDLLCRAMSKINSEAVTIIRGGRRYHFIAANQVKGLDKIIQGVPLLHRVEFGR